MIEAIIPQLKRGECVVSVTMIEASPSPSNQLITTVEPVFSIRVQFTKEELFQIPEDFVSIVTKCTEFDRKDRPTANQLLQMIRALKI